MKNSFLRRCIWWGWRLLVTLLCVATILYSFWTGPRDIERYPDAANSDYYLPWPAGLTWRCIQGNRAVVSHRGFDEFAYDFAMPVGSDVCAARSGVVIAAIDSHDGSGRSAPNNYIQIRHADGTRASYLHLKRGGAAVRKGDRVERGQRIAASGNVGRSMMPHLHFHVTDAEHNYIPVTFRDVPSDRGIPRMFKTYTSGNGSP